MDCLGRLLYAYHEGISIDPALRDAFGIPTYIPSIIQQLGVDVGQGCASAESLIQADCTIAHNIWRPNYPRVIP